MAPAVPLLVLKAHNKGYTRKDGTVVPPFDTKAPAASPPPLPKIAKWSAAGSPAVGLAKPGPGLYGGFMAPDHDVDLGQAPKPVQGSFWGSKSHQRPLPKSAVAHPQKGPKDSRVMIHYPHKPSEPATWSAPDAIATFTPGCALPEEINGIPLSPWTPPASPDEWDFVDGQNDALEEPGMDLPHGLVPASGVVVLEPDGRVWVVAPTNRFAGTKHTFPKGQRDYGLSLQANAIKECFEEAGLKVEIDSFLGDIKRHTSVARYYLARRVAGTPADMGWESQAVQLVPAGKLVDHLDRGDDRKVAAWLEGLV